MLLVVIGDTVMSLSKRVGTTRFDTPFLFKHLAINREMEKKNPQFLRRSKIFYGNLDLSSRLMLSIEDKKIEF